MYRYGYDESIYDFDKLPDCRLVIFIEDDSKRAIVTYCKLYEYLPSHDMEELRVSTSAPDKEQVPFSARGCE